MSVPNQKDAPEKIAASAHRSSKIEGGWAVLMTELLFGLMFGLLFGLIGTSGLILAAYGMIWLCVPLVVLMIWAVRSGLRRWRSH